MHVLLAGTISGVGSEGEKLATVFTWCVVQIATESSLSERAKLEQRIEDLENSLHTVSPIKTVHFSSSVFFLLSLLIQQEVQRVFQGQILCGELSRKLSVTPPSCQGAYHWYTVTVPTLDALH